MVASLIARSQPEHGEEGEHEGDGDGHADEGPPPLTMSMMRGMANQPAITTTMMIAEAISASTAFAALSRQSANPPSGEMVMPVVKSLSSEAR